MPLDRDQIDRIAALFSDQNYGNVYGACMMFLTSEQRLNFPASGMMTNIAVARKAMEVLCMAPPTELEHPLKRLLDDLEDAGKFDDGEYSKFVHILRSVPAEVQDRIFSSLLMDRFAFVNQTNLKSILEDMIPETTNTPILTINGPPKSGKTYSSLLLKHFCRTKNDVLLCEIKMDENNFQDMTVESICRDMMLKLSYTEEMDLEGTANVSAWCEDMACNIIRQVNVLLNAGTCSQIWFFLDGFKKALLNHDDYEGEKEKTSKFLQCFYGKFTDGIISKKCRLILSGYDVPLLDETRFSSRLYQNTKVTVLDVKEAVKTILSRAENIDQDQIDDMTDSVFDQQFGNLTFPITTLDVLETPLTEITTAALL